MLTRGPREGLSTGASATAFATDFAHLSRLRVRLAVLLVEVRDVVGGADQLSDHDVFADERREALRNVVEWDRLHAFDLRFRGRQMLRQQMLQVLLPRVRLDLDRHAERLLRFLALDANAGGGRIPLNISASAARSCGRKCASTKSSTRNPKRVKVSNNETLDFKIRTIGAGI